MRLESFEQKCYSLLGLCGEERLQETQGRKKQGYQLEGGCSNAGRKSQRLGSD